MGGPPGAPLDLHVYTGTDASFVWHEDAGDGYADEQGESARVTFDWDETEPALFISGRAGSFGGVAAKRVLNISIHTPDGSSEWSVEYAGTAIEM